MPHVSKRKLDSEILERLLSQLIGVFKVAGNKNILPTFIEELFTKTEKAMLAKRLAAIILLYKEMPQHIISERLKLSPSTVAKLSLSIESGMYDGIIRVIKKRSDELLEMAFKIILDNLPSPFGRQRRRYQSIYKDSHTNTKRH